MQHKVNTSQNYVDHVTTSSSEKISAVLYLPTSPNYAPFNFIFLKDAEFIGVPF